MQPQPTGTPRAVGIFADQKHAVEAARALLKAGYKPEQIVLVARDWRNHELADLGVEVQHAADRGAATGAAVGGGIGLAAGALTLLIPGVGAAALALVALAGLTGATAGSVVGPFAAMEMSEAEAREHAEHVAKGRTIVVVRTPDRQHEARTLMIDHGAYDFSMATN